MNLQRQKRSRSRWVVRGESCVYHVVNRTALNSMILNDEAKAVLVKQMRRQADFAGVEVLAYCVLTNHFHVLVRVPKQVELGDGELLRRYRILYGEHCPDSAPEPNVLEKILQSGGSDAALWRRRLHARMHQLSPFVSELKQRFSIWYNKHRNNRGTLWSERFKSIIVEDRPEYIAPVAAYIDLNPVRAESVTDPSLYAYSGYGAISRGDGFAKRGLLALYSGSVRNKRVLEDYQFLLYGRFESASENEPLGAESSESKLRKGERLSWAEYLRLRLAYFTRGVILGSAAFVQSYGGAYKLTSSGNAVEGVSSSFYCLRSLRKKPIGDSP